jgi:hypothetical protein
LHSKQVASVSVLYIRNLLLCSIYDPVSNLSFTKSLEMSLLVWQLTLNNGWIFPFSRFSDGIQLVDRLFCLPTFYILCTYPALLVLDPLLSICRSEIQITSTSLLLLEKVRENNKCWMKTKLQH